MKAAWMVGVAAMATSCGSNPAAIDAQPAEGSVMPALALAISPAQNDFGVLFVGNKSGAAMFTVTNTGTTAGDMLVASASGATTDFAIATTTCTGALAPAATCMVGVTFAPHSAVVQTATLRIVGSPQGSSTASLSGRGSTGGDLAIAPAARDFGTISSGATSAPLAFQVINSGSEATTTNTVTITGADAGQFTKTIDGCNGAQLAAMSSCTITLVFSPTTTGTKIAAVQLASTAGGSVSGGVTGTAN